MNHPIYGLDLRHGPWVERFAGPYRWHTHNWTTTLQNRNCIKVEGIDDYDETITGHLPLCCSSSQVYISTH